MRPKKKFGQHFLVDGSVIDRMLKAALLQKSDHVLEVGPGRGVLTQALIAAVGRLTAVEVDRDLEHVLKPMFQKSEHAELFIQDVLSQPLEYWRKGKPFRIVSNLPYCISTPFLFLCMENREHIVDLHLLLQEDLVDRIVAVPNTKAYGQLSVLLQLYFDVKKLFSVPPQSFHPPPKVESAVVALVPKMNEPNASMVLLHQLVKEAFNQRRKMLRKSMKKWEIKSSWLDLSRRPESLSVEEWLQLTKDITRKRSEQ